MNVSTATEPKTNLKSCKHNMRKNGRDMEFSLVVGGEDMCWLPRRSGYLGKSAKVLRT